MWQTHSSNQEPVLRKLLKEESIYPYRQAKRLILLIEDFYLFIFVLVELILHLRGQWYSTELRKGKMLKCLRSESSMMLYKIKEKFCPCTIEGDFDDHSVWIPTEYMNSFCNNPGGSPLSLSWALATTKNWFFSKAHSLVDWLSLGAADRLLCNIDRLTFPLY